MIDVLHHQVPRTVLVLRAGCVISVRRVDTRLQHLQHQRRRRLQVFTRIRRELTDLIHLTAIRIFIRDRQDFVLVQRGLQGDKSQRAVQRIFAARQQPCRFNLLVLVTAVHHGLQQTRHLLDIANAGDTRYRRIQTVGVIVGSDAAGTAPRGVIDMRTGFTQVHEGRNISRLVVTAALVRDPYLDLVNRHAAGNIRQTHHRLFVLVAEEISQEEMPVFVVLVGIDLVLCHLRAALTVNRLALRVLLRNQALNLQLTELQGRLESEQRLCSANKARVQVHRHITGLDRLDNIILVPLVLQLQVLLVKRETGFGIVVQRKA